MGSLLSKNLKGRKVTRNATGPPIPPSPPASVTKAAEAEEINGPSLFRAYQDPIARDDQCDFPLDQSELSSVSNDRLLELFLTAPRVHHYAGVRIVRISKSLVIKGGGSTTEAEEKNMVFAAQSLHLPVPAVHRSFGGSIPNNRGGFEKGHFIVMDYIPGPTVEDCWKSLTQEERESVALQVANMIGTMQSKALNELPPGPLGGTGGMAFEGPWFTDYGAGPFATLQDIENWYNHKIDVCLRFHQIPADAPRFKFHDQAFTLQDIAPRNLIVGAQGKVWLIDWGCAGVYPRGFEQVALSNQANNEVFLEMVLSKISDRHEALLKQYRAISYGLSVAACS